MEDGVVIEEYGREPQRKWRSTLDKTTKQWRVGQLDRGGSRLHQWTSLIFWRQLLFDVFLPQGFPHSVSEDYVQYQIWDTIQAFASSINGALATEAVLKGVGVGDQTATALAASLTWLMKDGVGMMGRIVFAWSQGSRLDRDCKKWRLIADALNDLAFVIDLLAGNLMIPILFTPLVCLSSALRAIVGVAGAATRTSVTQHQALRNNLGDVAAKDGSQETLVNFCALLTSLVLLPAVSGRLALIALLCTLFIAIHLFANYRAVRSLHLNTLNRRTLRLVVQDYCLDGTVKSVKETNIREPLFRELTGHRHYGCPLRDLLQVSGDNLITQTSAMALELIGDVGWVAVGVKSDRPIDQLRAAFRLEYRSVSGKWPEELDECKFEAQLFSLGWKTDVHHLGFDEWTYRLQG